MFSLSKSQIFLAGGFLVILVSIPLAFSLVKQSQLLSSKASEIKRAKTQSIIPLVTPQQVPELSPNSDLEKFIQESANTLSPTPTSDITNTISSFGPTLNLTINIEGRATGNNATKLFLGIAKGQKTVKPTYILTFTIDIPASGTFDGLSLAGLDTGTTYTAYLKGSSQIDTGVTFSMNPSVNTLNSGQPVLLLSGDLNEDNTVNTADYTIAKSLYGKTSASPNWNERADFNADGVINNLDFSYIIKNFGKNGDSGVWYSPPPEASPSASLNTGVGGVSTSSGGYWVWFPLP